MLSFKASSEYVPNMCLICAVVFFVLYVLVCTVFMCVILFCFVLKLRHSIRAVSGVPLSSSGLEEALQKWSE